MPRGASASLGQGRVECPAGLPLHRHPLLPLVPQFPHQQMGWQGRAVATSIPGWVGGVLGAGGKGLCPQEGWEGGSVRVGGGLCISVQPGGLCPWGGQGEGSAFLGRSSGAALELVGGDSDSAGRWRWSLSPDNIIFHGPSGAWRGLEYHGDIGARLCQGCDPHAWVLPIPRAPPGGSEPGWSRGAAPWVRPSDSTGLTELLPSPGRAEGEDLQAVRAGARGQQGSESPFQ